MAVTANTLVSTLVEEYPYAEEVFAWHGVTLDASHGKMSLYALCWIEGVELDEVLTALLTVIGETEAQVEAWVEATSEPADDFAGAPVDDDVEDWEPATVE